MNRFASARPSLQVQLRVSGVRKHGTFSVFFL